MINFDAAAARQAGYSDGEIASYLATQSKFDLGAAKKAGYDDSEIVGFLTAKPATASSTIAPTEYGAAPDAGSPRASASQSQVGADINSVAQGLIGGTGAAIAGVGRQTLAAAAQGTQRQLAVMDAIDKGETVPQDQDAIGYQFLSPEQRVKARAEFTSANTDLDKREPNMAMRAGKSVEDFGQSAFPVAPENEGIQTGVGRMIGGAVPVLAATAAGGAVGGPVGGTLAGAALIGSQTYDSTYQDAISKGATHQAAEDAAGKSAATQALTMALPMGRLVGVPVPFREGLAKTLVNLGQHGIEFGSANAVGTFANNYVAQQTYDPERSLTQGTGDAALEGAIAGLIIPTVAGIARARPTIADIGKAPTVDDAIKTAAAVVDTPGGLAYGAPWGEARASASPESAPSAASSETPAFLPPNASAPVLPRILDLINEDNRVAANRPEFVPPSAEQPSIPKTWSEVFAGKPAETTPADAPEPTAAPEPAVPQSVGAAASRDMTPPDQLAIPADEAAAIRLQGEIERFATPPRTNDTTLYVPETKPTLAETTGDPRAAMDQAYNKQQPEAMQAHEQQQNHNADQITTYYADTAESKPQLQRLERERDARASANIQDVFGDPQEIRRPADTTNTLDVIQRIQDNPRQAERDSVINVLTKLEGKFYDADGNPKTDPYALYGIGEHINDLLRGVGDTETSSAARVLKRELMQIKESLYNDIEAAAPGFAKYRAEYQADSARIDALKYLQDERLALLNKDMHITPAKWFSFMKRIIEGRADPMDPASGLSEAQMDRLWNITDHLKRQTFIDAGKPRGSWTSMMQEWGGRFARTAAHLAVLPYAPAVGNLGIEMGMAALRKRSVAKEMNRVLNPDLGQPSP